MADLLECLLQIKGLHGTIDRLERLVASAARDRWTPDALGVLAGLAEMEIVHGAAIRVILAQRDAVLPAMDPTALAALSTRLGSSPQHALDRFVSRRRDNLELLDGCSAEDLSRIGVHPARRAMALADLIAVMLANDVESVGEIRNALAGPEP